MTIPLERLPLEQWIAILGPEFVNVDRGDLARAETATFATTQGVCAILRPGNVEEVRQCLKIANLVRAPLYPISTGRNWGYGSRVPPVGSCTLLDLSRLNRILDFSEELGYVTVEAGVTQRQLYQYLLERKSNLWMDATGSSPDCSLIGNAMERGFGHTPYGDHIEHVCGLEVVLPEGEVIQTGYARFPGSRTGPLSRWGTGPSVDGLFSQSNLGVVTRMTVQLMPKPETFEAFFFRCSSRDQLAGLIDALRRLRMDNVLRSAIHIGNDYKVLAGLQQYPWEETQGGTPLSPEVMSRFRKKLGLGYWSASGGIYGTASQVSATKRDLSKALAPVKGKLQFLNEKTLCIAERFAKPFFLLTRWDIKRTVELVRPVMGLLQGIPTEQPLASAYWRKRFRVPTDPNPDRDRCGLLWYSPIAPANGTDVSELTTIATDTLPRFGFEPLISLTVITPRTVACVISITYDREVAGQDESARSCYDELARRCTSQGYYPYRLAIGSMAAYCEMGGPDLVQKAIKKALDPNGILAPGRYGEP